ncbi:MAG: ferredoxin--NADP reductase [Saprospiraceae bacterium]|nr:ferredoxin--NADP reductase [Saprospiraceae bacterium]
MSKSFHNLTVKQVTPETADTVTLTFEVPAELAEQYKFTQGQYLTLRFMLGGKEERRSYSMCSSPLEAGLSVTVKRVKGGKVSNHIFDKIKVGDVVDVMTPDGRFFTDLNDENKKNYYLVGAGSGITPLMSILKTVLEAEPMSFVFLLFGSRNEDEIIFKNQLDALTKRYDGQLHVEHALSQPKLEKAKGLGGLFSKGKPTWTGKTGRIDAAMFRKFMEEHPPRHKDSEFFLCGPGGMIDAVEKALLDRGVDKKNIHHEYFSASPSATPVAAGGVMDGAKLIAHLDGKVIETTVTKGKHLLFAVIDAGADAPYSCTSGACATCMAKVVKGTVKMDACYALDESEIKQGFILTCQAHPTSEVVEIKF